MYNFNGITIQTTRQMINVLNHLNSILDLVTATKQKIASDSDLYLVSIKKDHYFKEFFISVSKYTKEISYIRFNGCIISNMVSIEAVLLSIEDEIYAEHNPRIRDVMNMIRCENHKCPICDSNMEVSNKKMKYKVLCCPNDCYSTKIIRSIENENNLLTFVSFFDGEEVINTHSTLNHHVLHTKDIKESHRNRLQLIYDIYKNINYWKTDERYLIKMLS